ncbi:hypothetical protein MKX01_022857 [Papaver californicum]|nr:hypothetical protein MKX01_022857 [Papaver californicum]
MKKTWYFYKESTGIKKTTDGTKKGVLRKGLEGCTFLTVFVALGPISSHAEKQILATVPGKVLLDSLGTLGRLIDAAEVAEKQVLSASSKAASKMVSNRSNKHLHNESI